jgi:hypothetical protein
MRLSRLALPGLASLVLIACNPTVSFDSPVEATATIQGSSLPISGPLTGLGFNNINFNQSANLSNNNTDKDHVVHVTQKSFTLSVTSPSGGDLSFLQSLAFSVSAANLPTVEIAHQTVFPKGQASVDMVIDNVDLAPYAKADSFSITSTGSGTAPSKDTTIDIKLVLTIEAHVL